MNMTQREDVWAAGALYEPYVGRWSRLVARAFLPWLGVPEGSRWIDVGCGTGALSQTILESANPQSLQGFDTSSAFVAHAQAHVRDERASFIVGDAQSLPVGGARADAAVSGLVLNFVPQPQRAASEMARVVRPGGVVAAYVWDYAGRMEMMRCFWDAAVALDATALALDEGRRFPLCAPEPLIALFAQAGLQRVEARAIDVPTVFRDFDDYWSPFLGGQGPAPGYAKALDAAQLQALRERIRHALPVAESGSIRLTARAWAVRGRKA
jgi:SAM-dependent methyltransferase